MTAPCPIAATEVMAFTEIRDQFSGFSCIGCSFGCDSRNLYSGTIYTGDRQGSCKGVKTDG